MAEATKKPDAKRFEKGEPPKTTAGIVGAVCLVLGLGWLFYGLFLRPLTAEEKAELETQKLMEAAAAEKEKKKATGKRH